MAQQTYGEWIRSNPPIPNLTAVEWIAEKMKKLTPPGYQIEISAMLRKAKQMEKEQAFQSFKAGQDSMEEGGKNFEQYYNETYGNEGV